MPIEFQCPNGHRIVCPEDRAGREAKCPRCGAGFRIPSPNGSSPAASRVPAEQTPAEDMIVFLCPNGHRLNAPARLQGKAGQCPHCGAKFIVPDPGEVEESEEFSIDQFQAGAASGDALGLLADDDMLPMPGEGGPPDGTTMPQNVDRPASRSSASSVHPLCDLVSKLWEEKQHGGVIELHLEGGAVLVPDWFDEPLSRSSHGLFAAQSADGTVTMTVVAWNSITRVVVRNLEGLPHGMFE